jgi:hypothetical protein
MITLILIGKIIAFWTVGSVAFGLAIAPVFGEGRDE